MPSAQLSRLRSVFGPLTQNPPELPPQDELQVPDVEQDPSMLPDMLPAQPVFDLKTEILLIPSHRIDGSQLDAPWNLPEPEIWNWLRTTTIEHIDEQIHNGSGGSFLAWCRNEDEELRAVFIRFDTVGFDQIYETWGQEYTLQIEAHDPLRREQGAYEVAKALGCEDMVPPIAARAVNLVPLISDAIREMVAAKYGIAPLLVDETFGVIGALQLMPLNAVNFVEHWATLGADSANRFMRASDAVRHSIYRMVALDFVLGTGNRMLSDVLLNRSTGTLAMYGFGVTFPNPAGSADRYLAQRAQGWGRALPAPTQDPTPGVPPCGSDTFWWPREFGEKEIDECLMTFKQISTALRPEIMTVLCQALIDIGVPQDNVAGFVSRVTFLQEDPETIVANQADYVRSILVPMRRGYGFEEGRNAKIVEIVNETMTNVTGAPYDFVAVMQSA